MVKSLLLSIAVPAARLRNLVSASSRLWSFARLQASLKHHVPRSTVVLGAPEVHGTADIHLGANAYLYPGLYLETWGSGRIQIGDSVVISRGAHLVSGSSVCIGEGSMIGEYTSIRDARHGFGHEVAPREATQTASPIHIGRHVWIGRGAAILAGVTIGDYAVVGANAVVTRDVAAGACVAGVPARPITSSHAVAA